MYKQGYETIIQNALKGYQRWVEEGFPRYGDEQYYYDNYHDEIRYDVNSDEFSYHIQIYDSPEGDEWIRGKFKKQGDMIEIIKNEDLRS